MPVFEMESSLTPNNIAEFSLSDAKAGPIQKYASEKQFSIGDQQAKNEFILSL